MVKLIHYNFEFGKFLRYFALQNNQNKAYKCF